MRKATVKDWFSFFGPRFLALTLILGFLIRIALVFHPLTVVDWGLWDWIKIVVLGFLNDVAFTAIALVPAFIFYSFLTDAKYKKPTGYIVWGALLLLTLYIVLCNDITDEYGGPLPRIVNAVLIFITACFSIKLFVPAVRAAWRKAAIYIMMMLYSCFAITIAFSEIVFWSEFGVRFNFIAVDYLVYTNEVIGNIFESYPMGWMISAMLLIAGAICWLMIRGKDISRSGLEDWRHWLRHALTMVVSCVVACLWLHNGYRNFGSDNLFATQIQQNGCWDFLEAFMSNELDYEQFYPMLPDEEVATAKKELCHQNADGIQAVRDSLPELHKNIVLITIESLSAEYLTRYGCEDGITPNLDSLAANGLVFDSLYATGNRTVRGLEAVTLCLPPSAGESLVKRPQMRDFFSTGKILQQRGYKTSFIYGGDSYFDNMGTFFGACGYSIEDKGTYDKDAIVFSNIWGTSDEDSYREAIGRIDASYAAGEPFFGHIMTISNHRPYTYPEGRIQYDGNPMSRRAAVKYTDWAIGKFMADAATKPWFPETVFVILADHCASSAGKTSLPLECYHIPAIIYAPGFVEPATVDKVCSQIDLMPTLLSMLHFTYDSQFYGQDILAPDFRERAFMATYQDLGFYADGVLTVLSPVRKVQQETYGKTVSEDALANLLREAIIFYQSANK